MRMALGVADALSTRLELGAATPTRGLYVTEQQFDDLKGTIGPWADGAAPRIARHLT